jgi:hypothetical protein
MSKLYIPRFGGRGRSDLTSSLSGLVRRRALAALLISAAAGLLPCAATAAPQSAATATAVRRAVHRIPSAPLVVVSLRVSPASSRRGTLGLFSRNRIALGYSRGGAVLLRVDRHRHRVARVRAGRSVVIRISLDFSAGRISATAARRRVAFRRTLVGHERLVLTGRPCCVRVLGIRASRKVATEPLAPVTDAPIPAPVVAGGTVPRLFAATSVWNSPLPPGEPLDPASGTLVNTLTNIVAANLSARSGPWIQTSDSSTPLYQVPADQPTSRVQLDAGSWAVTLQAAFQAVPIPSDARPAAGPDGHLTIWQPSTDRLWELYRARPAADGWHADFGGAIMHVSESPGYYTPLSWPGAIPQWGATATSLPVIAGTMLISELQSGTIPHALAVAVPFARAGMFTWPAQRTDGTSTDPASIPEGARFRLDPTLDIAALGLPPMTRMMAEAVQRYGMIVRDQTSNALAFYGEDPSPSGSNPYAALFGNQYPIDLLASFPWDHLQLLKMDLRSR